MKKKKRGAIIFLFSTRLVICREQLPVTIAGLLKSANGLGQVALNLMNIYNPLTDLFFIDTRPDVLDLTDLPSSLRAIIKKSRSFYPCVSFFTDQLTVDGNSSINILPENSIKYAYSMVESTRIPSQWVTLLNTYFDAVIVPDAFLVSVYQESGVTLPIFELPLPLEALEKCLMYKPKQERKKPFTFGTSALLAEHKNIDLLIQAFAQEYGNNPDFFLRIHAYQYNESYLARIDHLVDSLALNNFLITIDQLSTQEYTDLMHSWDCLVLLSKGEGFSITPRLAMGLGVPCILSNNTAHKTIVNTGLVYGVKADSKQESPAEFYSESVGHIFNCTLTDARTALRTVYQNYSLYLEKADKAREWVEQYLPENLTCFYEQLIKPKKIEYGLINSITKEGIITNSYALIKKYEDYL